MLAGFYVCLTALLCLQADVENQGKPAKAKIDKTKAVPRAAAGQKWYDATLSEWPENDFRIFVGDMGNEVNDDILTKAFTKYAAFQKAKIVRDKHSNKSKGALVSDTCKQWSTSLAAKDTLHTSAVLCVLHFSHLSAQALIHVLM